jgi:shikimate O-hydroxycinnamoyltransferase
MKIIPTMEYIRAAEPADSSSIWKFTVLDKNCLRMVIRGTWLFDSQLDEHRLKEGLTMLLELYPQLAGRMKDPSGITLNNAGVPLLITEEAQGSIHDDFNSEKLINSFSTEIVTEKFMRGQDPPLTVRITRLKDGSVLGIRCSHACIDGVGFYSMVQNLARICKNEPIEMPVVDQSLVPVPEEMTKEQVVQEALERGWLKISIGTILKMFPAVLTGALNAHSRGFHIPAEILARWRTQISDKTGSACGSHTALVAHIAHKCLSLSTYKKDASCYVVNVMNIREHLEGIPSAFAGNAVSTIATPSFPVDSSIGEIAEINQQTLQPMMEKPSAEHQRFHSLYINAINRKAPVLNFDFSKMHAARPTVFYINNVSKLPVYDVDFGTGKPIRVIPHNLGDPILIWPAPTALGGVEVYFSSVLARKMNKMKPEFFQHH